MIETLIKPFLASLLKKYKGDVSFLGVGQKTTVARLWHGIKAFDMKFSVGLFVERTD